MEKLRLADMLVMLRGELMEARQRAAKQKLKFNVEEMEVEVQFTTSLEGGGSVGADFWVVDAELGGKIDRETVHTVRLKMKPDFLVPRLRLGTPSWRLCRRNRRQSRQDPVSRQSLDTRVLSNA